MRWNLDPALVLIIGTTWLAYTLLANSPHARIGARQWFFHLGWLTTILALTSPLCALSVSLFSARVGQHMILTLIAAPLVTLGRPWRALQMAFPRTTASFGKAPFVFLVRGPTSATLMFAGAMWFWHSPAPYAATFANPWVYWLMHVSTFGSALLLWRVLIDQRHQMVTGISAGAVSTLQMTFLGAIITLTPHALYSQHMLTPLQWGMTQITDQQLGGLLMWVPGCTVFLAVTLLGLGRALSDRTPTNLEAVDI